MNLSFWGESKIKTTTFIRCLNEYLLDLRHSQSHHYSEKVLFYSNQIKDKGIAIIENYYSPENCIQILTSINTIIAEMPDKIDTSDNIDDKKLWGAERVSKQIATYFTDTFLNDIASHYLGYKAINYCTMAGLYTQNSSNSLIGSEWHRDSEFERQVKAILYLTDVKEENAPYGYVENSHTMSSVIETSTMFEKKTDYSENILRKLELKGNYKIKNYLGAAGTVVLTDTRGIHRRGPLLKDKRAVLMNYYVGNHRYHLFNSYFGKYIKFNTTNLT